MTNLWNEISDTADLNRDGAVSLSELQVDIMMFVVVVMVHGVDRDGAVSFSELQIMLMIMIVINGHIGDHGGA